MRLEQSGVGGPNPPVSMDAARGIFDFIVAGFILVGFETAPTRIVLGVVRAA
ncbi:hypothetical protein [Nocardioides guangzhouensis]|uniref:hypothetical protein n=1 Tax=Nocardioides guangzhouensis TaxID=2497878 RepID=UPI0014386A22|nr:hypothetical protein [Nocardioides guangzhouensis]